MGRRFLSLVLCLAWAGAGAAGTPPSGEACRPGGGCDLNGCPSLGCCPDDYCRKPCPVLFPPALCGGPDDYCRKPFPCLGDVPRCGGPDDYCRKALPCLLCQPWSPYLRCGPPAPCCAPPNRH